MQVVTQFSVFLVNKPGLLGLVCDSLASAKVNILAMSMMDSTEHGVLRMVVENPEKARAAVQNLNIPITETKVLLIDFPNKPGALAEVCGRLADAHVNINYAYCTTGPKGGKVKGVLKVANNEKAQKVLAAPRDRRKDMTKKLRRPAGLRGKR
jgi:hypothetical protein